MNDSNSSFLAGFVIGGLIGVAAALVFAPQRATNARVSFGNRAVSLNRSVNQSSTEAETSTDSYFDEDVKDDVRRTYEPPRIILDEGTSASTPPNSD